MTMSVFNDDALMRFLEDNNIPYQYDETDDLITVNGDISIPVDYDSIKLDRLKTVYGEFRADMMWHSDCHLPQLEKISGYLTIRTKDSQVELPKLKDAELLCIFSKQQLETLSFPVLEKAVGLATDAKKLHVPALVEIKGVLWAMDAHSFSALQLETIGDDLKLDVATSLNVPMLKRVDGFLEASRVDVFGCPSLEYVGENLDARNAREFYADNLEKVDGVLDISNAEEVSVKKLKIMRVNAGAAMGRYPRDPFNPGAVIIKRYFQDQSEEILATRVYGNNAIFQKLFPN